MTFKNFIAHAVIIVKLYFRQSLNPVTGSETYNALHSYFRSCCNCCNHSPGNGCSITQVKTCLHEYKTWYFLAGTFFGGARMRLIRF